MLTANILIVAIYFRLPAIWDDNFILNEERIRHNEVNFLSSFSTLMVNFDAHDVINGKNG